jgi:hypothetical protein
MRANIKKVIPINKKNMIRNKFCAIDAMILAFVV